MWCAKCQAEVAAEVASDNRRIRCASCGSEIDAARTLRTSEKTREARELLQRWSSSRLLEPSAATTAAAEPTAAAEAAEGPPSTVAPEPAVKSPVAPTAAKGAMRFDKPHSPAAAPHEAPAPQHVNIARPPVRERRAATSEPTATETVSLPPRTHAAHAAVPPPHTVDVQSAIIHDEPRPTHWLAACGQLLAYAGVLGLTVGTTLVVWGHFGGAEQQHYTPNGWLVATAGQMLLFLGVVTMVSGGLEQTTEEVRRRVDRLGDRLARIEHTLRYQPPRETTRLAEIRDHAPPAQNEQRAAA